MFCVLFVLTSASSFVFAAESDLGGYSFTVDSGTWGFYRVNGSLSPVSGSFRAPSSSVSKNPASSVNFMPGSFRVSLGGLSSLSGKPFDVLIDFGRCAYVTDPFVAGSNNSADHFPISYFASGVPVSSCGFFQSCYGFDYSSFISKYDTVHDLTGPADGRFYRLLASFDSPSISDGSVGITVSFNNNFFLSTGTSTSSDLNVYDFVLNARVYVYPDLETAELCRKIYNRLGTMDTRLVSIADSLSSVMNELSLLVKTTKNIDALCDDINGAITTGNGIAEQIRIMVNQRFQSVLDYLMYAFFQTNTVNHENSWLYRIVNMFYDELIYTYSFYDAETQEWKRTDDSFLTSVTSNLQVLVDHSIQLDKVDSFGATAFDKADQAGVDDMYDSAIGSGTASKTDANNFVSGGLDSLGDLGSPGDLDGYTNDYYSWFSGKTADSLDSQYGKDTRGLNSSLPVIVTDYYAQASKRWNSDD